MISKLVSVPVDELQLPPGVEYQEHFNEMPLPYWEVDINEYLHFSNIYSYRFREFRQARLPEYYPADPRISKDEIKNWHIPLRSLHIEWYHDRGYAIVQPNKWTLFSINKVEQPALVTARHLLDPNDIVYTETPRYFRIGCQHVFTEERLRMHLHRVTCTICGFTEEVDSSG